MQKEHRDSIQRNFSSLVEQTDLDLMVAALYEKGVFSDSMIEPYKDTNKETRSRKRQLYRDITRRGPEAFRSLLDALSENGYWDLVRDLDPNSSLHTRNRTTPNQAGENSFLSIRKSKTGRDHNDVNRNRATPSTSINRNASGNATINTKTENGNNTLVAETGGNRAGTEQVPIPEFNVIKSTKFFEDDGSDIKLYRTRGRFRGVLVLFSYIEYVGDIDRFRRGAAVDSLNLRYLFTELGFKVLSYHNLSLKETRDTLSSLKEGIRGEGEGWPETVFIVVSSHGYPREGTGDYDLRCSDGGLVSFYQVIEYFNNVNFPALYEVPKVFIFQSCRGSKEEHFSYRPPPMHAPRPARHGGRSVHDGSPSRGAGHASRAPAAHDASDAPDARAVPARGDEAGAGDADNSRNRIYSDILIAHSTLPGYVSMRDPERGSWFIQALCDVFAARAHDTHVEDLFTLVDERLRRQYRVQTSSVDRWGFNRRLYLHPGMRAGED